MTDIARCMNAGAGTYGGETCVRSVFSMYFELVNGKVMYVFVLVVVVCL
jgi:hypothetical protein